MRKFSILLICFVYCFALAACAGPSQKTVPHKPWVRPTPTLIKPTITPQPKLVVKKPTIKKVKVKQKFNINTASVKTLINAKHIGLIRARRIVQYRKKHGKFRSVDDLIKVKGISKQILMRIKQDSNLTV